MPAELTLYGRPVGTVFDLLGDKENDITYSVGWALAESERLSGALLGDVIPAASELTAEAVRLQEGVSGAGFTDIEILAGDGEVHVVIEAKRGYDLPQLAQLQKYATRTQPPPSALVVCAEASAGFAAGKLPDAVAGVPVRYRSWREIEALVSLAANDARRHAEKRLLRDLSRYLKGVMTMQDVSSNLVYVVSLGTEIEDTGISFRDVVVDHGTRSNWLSCSTAATRRWDGSARESGVVARGLTARRRCQASRPPARWSTASTLCSASGSPSRARWPSRGARPSKR